MRILLADDNRLLLEGLTSLATTCGHEIVATATDGLEAVFQARVHRPDLVLMDVRMPRCDGLAATRLIAAELPEVRVVMLTTSDEDGHLFGSIVAGACGYLLKSVSGDELIEALAHAAEGVPPFSPGLAQRLLDEFRRRSSILVPSCDQPVPDAHMPAGQRPEPAVPSRADGDGVRLTDRQVAVLRLVAAGSTYKEVAVELSLSERTVRYHMAEVMTQLHLAHRAEAVAWAGRTGLLEPR